MTHPEVDLSCLARPSGGFAMLAVDQREALRAMLAEHQSDPVPDEQLTRFKVDAIRALGPHASAVLVDREFGLDAALDEGALEGAGGLIVAADHFIAGPDELVTDVEIDRLVVAEDMKACGAAALKLLVLWRPDEPADKRVTMVGEFVETTRQAGLISIIEPVSRGPRDGGPWDRDAGILGAARELGSLGADLYKAEVPTGGQGEQAQLRRSCARLTELISSPWVVLSSGVPRHLFPRAVEMACREGASGFLAGRAVWSNVIGAVDQAQELRHTSRARLRELAEIVDANVTISAPGL